MAHLSLEERIQLNIYGVVRAIEHLEADTTDDDKQRGGALQRGYQLVVFVRPRDKETLLLAVDERLADVTEDDGGVDVLVAIVDT